MPLLRAGATITPRYGTALSESGIHTVWVHDEISSGIEPVDLVPSHVREEAARTVTNALAGAGESIVNRQALSPAVMSELSRIVDQIARAVAGHTGAALVLSDLASADAYTHQHSIDVCALGLLIGRTLFSRAGWEDYRGQHRVDGVDRRLHHLGMGLLLHDIGKMAIPSEILSKPGALTAEEQAIMRTHPEIGAELIEGDMYSPIVRAIVREHHERWDGLGYPQGLAGDQIHQLARIAAVADVYDAMTSERPYRPAQPPRVGVEVVTEGSGTQFDAEVVKVFRRVVFPFPVGTEVRLRDGSVGVVAECDPDYPDRPYVRFAEGERSIDLSDEGLAA